RGRRHARRFGKAQWRLRRAVSHPDRATGGRPRCHIGCETIAWRQTKKTLTTTPHQYVLTFNNYSPRRLGQADPRRNQWSSEIAASKNVRFFRSRSAQGGNRSARAWREGAGDA